MSSIEKVLLGTAMYDSGAAVEVASKTDPAFYESEKHQAIHRTISELIASGEPTDLISITDELQSSGMIVEAGGESYLSEVATYAGGAESIERYCRILQEQYLRRQLRRFGKTLAESQVSDPFQMLDDAQQAVLSLGEVGVQNGAAPASEDTEGILESWAEAAERRRAGKDVLTGVPTGYPKMDEILGGWKDTDLVIIAARPSMGKTALALDLAEHAAQEGVPTLIYSLEMSRSQLVQRRMCAKAEVESQKVTRGYATNDDLRKAKKAKQEIDKLDMYIDDQASQTVLSIKASARRQVQQNDVGLIIIDYLQLIESLSGNNRNEEVSKITRALKIMAKDLEVPVIALSQLSRAVESRSDKRPKLSDLRDSGSIEQDADVVIFIYRAERYGIEEHDELPGVSTEGLADIMVSKHRNGPLGTAYLTFIERFATFKSRAITKEDRRQAKAPMPSPTPEPSEGGLPF